MIEGISNLFEGDESVRDLLNFIICRDFCNLKENHERFTAFKNERLSKMASLSKSRSDAEQAHPSKDLQPVISKHSGIQIEKQLSSKVSSMKKEERKMESIEINKKQEKEQQALKVLARKKQEKEESSSKVLHLLANKQDSVSFMKNLENKITKFQPLVESDEQGCDYMLEDDAIGGEQKLEVKRQSPIQIHVDNTHQKKGHATQNKRKAHENASISNQIAQILANEVRPKRMEYKQTIIERKPIKHVSESSSDSEMIIQDEQFIVGRTKNQSQSKYEEDVLTENIKQTKPADKRRVKLSESSNSDIQITDDINE